MAELALSVTVTVSPVLNAVVLAVSQILSLVWALTFTTTARVKIIARVTAEKDFINTPRTGAHSFVRPYFFYVFLLPEQRAGFSIVSGQQFQVQNVDDTIVVQISGSWFRAVVAHPNCHGVKLINDIVVINIASQQADGRHRCGTPAS